MRITLEMHGALQRFNAGGQRRAVLEVADDISVGELLASRGVNPEAPWSAALDGALVEDCVHLSEGSHLIVFEPIAGG